MHQEYLPPRMKNDLILYEIDSQWFPLPTAAANDKYSTELESQTSQETMKRVVSYFNKKLGLECPTDIKYLDLLVTCLAIQSDKKEEHLERINNLEPLVQQDLIKSLEFMAKHLKPIKNSELIAGTKSESKHGDVGSDVQDNASITIGTSLVLNNGKDQDSNVSKLLFHWKEYALMADRVQNAEILMEKYKRKAGRVYDLERMNNELIMKLQLLENENSLLKSKGPFQGAKLPSNTNIMPAYSKGTLEGIKIASSDQSNEISLEKALQELKVLKECNHLIKNSWNELGLRFYKMKKANEPCSWLGKQRQKLVYEDCIKRSYLL